MCITLTHDTSHSASRTMMALLSVCATKVVTNTGDNIVDVECVQLILPIKVFVVCPD